MSDDDCQDDGWEEVGKGRKLKRGPDGKIEGHQLTAEAARSMQAGQGRNKAAKYEQDVSQLLMEAGYLPEEAPAHLRHLATLAVSGRAGAVSAITRFIAETRADRPIEQEQPPEIGSVCPTCRQYVGELDGDLLLQLIAALEAGWTPGDRGSSGKRRHRRVKNSDKAGIFPT
jgi:hypothetical protein